jgi:Cu-Zn family superoxide dismutase
MKASCVIQPQGGSTVQGTVAFSQASSGAPVVMDVRLRGFPKDGLFGFHIHRYGDLSEGCSSMCEHFDAGRGAPHGGPDDPSGQRHLGDLGNIRVRKGVCRATLTDPMLSLYGLAGKRSIIGRGVVVHERRDDLGQGGDAESLKTGNAGKRVACGVIALASDLYT